MFQTVVFDLDGTLLDTLQDLAGAGNHALAAMGLPTHPVDAYRKMVGSGIVNLVRRMLPPHNSGPSAVEIAHHLFETHYTAHSMDHTAPYPGVVDMLARLKAEGITLCVLSNKKDAYVQTLVQDYFPDLFTSVMGLCEGIPAKPDPTSALLLLSEVGGRQGDTLYVGDSDVDIVTARNAGLAGCGVLWGFRDAAELQAAGAIFLAEDVPVLQSLILH